MARQTPASGTPVPSSQAPTERISTPGIAGPDGGFAAITRATSVRRVISERR